MAGCGKKHGRHLLADDYIDTQVSASHSRSMSTNTEENIRPWKKIKTPIDQIVELDSKMGEMHQTLLLSLVLSSLYNIAVKFLFNLTICLSSVSISLFYMLIVFKNSEIPFYHHKF
jgi:hypothetical protein